MNLKIAAVLVGCLCFGLNSSLLIAVEQRLIESSSIGIKPALQDPFFRDYRYLVANGSRLRSLRDRNLIAVAIGGEQIERLDMWKELDPIYLTEANSNLSLVIKSLVENTLIEKLLDGSNAVVVTYTKGRVELYQFGDALNESERLLSAGDIVVVEVR